VSGGTSSIDIDAIFAGFSAGQLTFDAVQLVDDEFELGTSQGTHGADIDAVGAIMSSPIPIEGDFNGNHGVEQADLDLVLLHWGAAWPPEIDSPR